MRRTKVYPEDAMNDFITRETAAGHVITVDFYDCFMGLIGTYVLRAPAGFKTYVFRYHSTRGGKRLYTLRRWNECPACYQ